MPLYMDHHRYSEGLTKNAIAEAHQKDLKTQDKYGVRYIKYWFDDGTGQAFSLVEAPDKDAAVRVHRKAHGLVAEDITQVQEGAYQIFGPCHCRTAGADSLVCCLCRFLGCPWSRQVAEHLPLKYLGNLDMMGASLARHTASS